MGASTRCMRCGCSIRPGCPEARGGDRALRAAHAPLPALSGPRGRRAGRQRQRGWMMRRIRAGSARTKKCWELLKRHPVLLRFPTFAALIALVPLIVLVLPGLYLVDSHESSVAGIMLTVV